MFNTNDQHGYPIGKEVVEWNNQKWVVVGFGRNHLSVENAYSYHPREEYSCAVGMYGVEELIFDHEYKDVKPFASIVRKKGNDQEWEKTYRELGLMFEESFVNESCCE